MDQKNVHEVALFDFCETLVDFQTADAFVDFVRSQASGIIKQRMLFLNNFQNILWKFRIIPIIEKIFHGYSFNKRFKLFQLRGFSYSDLDELAENYYITRIKPHFIDIIISRLCQHQKENTKIIIVSGGYDIYLKYFKKDFGVDEIISTRIKFKNGICKGLFDGMDCMKENKIMLINRILNIDNSYFKVAYSDSRSDLPLLKFAKEGIVVVRRNNSIEWIKNNNLNMIIW